jgi:hypothetical protein
MSPFPRELRWFTLIVFGTAVATAALLVAHEGWPDLPTLVLFGVLVVYSAHLGVQVSGSVALSPGLMVCMAAIVVFVDRGALAGAMIACAMAHVAVTDFRPGRWGWVPFNAGVSALSFLAAAAVLQWLPLSDSSSTPAALVAVSIAALVYICAAWLLLLASEMVEGRRPWRDMLAELAPYGAQVFPFALVGFLLGRLYLALGAAVMLLIIPPILIAREMFASYMRVKDAHDETVALLIHALEQKDPYTAGHAGRVAVYAGYIAEELEFMPARAERLRFAALMHDIGKLVVPNQLLNKPGKLTEDEFKRIRIHEQVSVQMLSHIDFLRPIAGHGHSDAMRFDPDNTDHPIEPYIIMVADAYDAMTSTRAYRKALPQEVAFQELRDKSGTQFHPAAAEALIRAIERRHEIHGAGHEEESHFEDAPEMGLGSAGLGDLESEEAKQ